MFPPNCVTCPVWYRMDPVACLSGLFWEARPHMELKHEKSKTSVPPGSTHQPCERGSRAAGRCAFGFPDPPRSTSSARAPGRARAQSEPEVERTPVRLLSLRIEVHGKAMVLKLRCFQKARTHLRLTKTEHGCTEDHVVWKPNVEPLQFSCLETRGFGGFLFALARFACVRG